MIQQSSMIYVALKTNVFQKTQDRLWHLRLSSCRRLKKKTYTFSKLLHCSNKTLYLRLFVVFMLRNKCLHFACKKNLVKKTYADSFFQTLHWQIDYTEKLLGAISVHTCVFRIILKNIDSVFFTLALINRNRLATFFICCDCRKYVHIIKIYCSRARFQ